MASKSKEISVEIIKSSGKRVQFSIEKLKDSLRRSGANEKTVHEIVDSVIDELYPSITTKEIYKRAFKLLKKSKPLYASKYKLKRAIFELGPTGFPFEKFIGAILKYSGYKVKVGKIINGKCVNHEVDIIAKKNGEHIIGECKFHGEYGKKCNIKIPLYIFSRYQDILSFSKEKK